MRSRYLLKRELEPSQLTVADGGVGMDAATLERCFEPFFTTKDRGKGTGLGLATVYRVVDEAGGTVSVESTPGVGTTVKVTLPAVAEEPTALAPVRAPDAGDFAAAILLVEDDAEVRGFARTVLVEAGYTVHEAACGAGAQSSGIEGGAILTRIDRVAMIVAFIKAIGKIAR